MDFITLRNGMQIPQIGLGTWQIIDREVLKALIPGAFNEGYRLIDMAAAYGNEISIAKAISEAEVPRNELILSDKVWNTSRGYNAVQEACRKSLKKLKTDYFDIYLIHWPASMALFPDWAEINADTWRGMEQLYKDGLVRSIGVCNFKIHHLEELDKTATIIPMINQVEMHPGMPQDDLLSYCNEREIVIEASSPLGSGQVLTNNILVDIARAKEKSPSQICIKWLLQKGVIALPKTSKCERLSTNINLDDFYLSEEEIKIIDEIPYCGGIGIDSDEVTEFG